MNVLILNAGNTYNYGSMMMAENLIHYSRLENPDNRYYIHADEIHIQRLRDATGLEDLKAVSYPDLIWCKKFRLAKYLHRARIPVASSLLKKMDRIYFLGGDDFTEIYGQAQLIFCLDMIDMLKSKTNYLALIGQTIGPFSADLEPRALRVFRRMDLISLREPTSMQYLQQAGLTNIVRVSDLALLPLCREPKEPESRQKNTVLFCPSQIMHQYARIVDAQQFKQLNEKIARHLLADPAIRLVILPHVYDDRTNGDLEVAQDLYDRLADVNDRVEYLRGPVLPYQVREIIRRSRCIVAERMHPAISGLACETPSLVFSYGRKYQGIFEELYQLGPTIVDIRQYADYDTLWADVQTALDYVLSHDGELREQIREKNKQARREVLAHIHALSAADITG